MADEEEIGNSMVRDIVKTPEGRYIGLYIINL